MKTLAVAGCSISDRTKTTHCYGDFLSEQLGVNYLHLAGGGGSNHRSIRLIQENILNGNLVSGDTVILQVTDVTRREIPSARLSTTPGRSIASAIEMEVRIRREDAAVSVGNFGYHDDLEVCNLDITPYGVYSRFKVGSSSWQPRDEDAELHALYEKEAVVTDIGLHEFRLQLAMLRTFVHSYGITFVVFWDQLGRFVYREIKEKYNIDDIVCETDILLDDVWPDMLEKTWITDDKYQQYHLIPGEDWIHFSVAGHKKLADLLFPLLKNR